MGKQSMITNTSRHGLDIVLKLGTQSQSDQQHLDSELKKRIIKTRGCIAQNVSLAKAYASGSPMSATEIHRAIRKLNTNKQVAKGL